MFNLICTDVSEILSQPCIILFILAIFPKVFKNCLDVVQHFQSFLNFPKISEKDPKRFSVVDQHVLACLMFNKGKNGG